MIDQHIAGSPMDEKVKWVDLSRGEISALLKQEGVKASRNLVRKLLKQHGFVKRKMLRKKSTGQFADRNTQFENITQKIKSFTEAGNPIVSIDTKKKEYLGKLHREGKVYCKQAIEVYDHDFQSLASGKIVPHGIYDVKNNKAHINIGISSETSEFVCKSIKLWWESYGQKDWPNADEILILCDAGGANSYRHHVFKAALQQLTNDINIKITVAHYPPYASKWNLIEHRVFPHITRAMQGVPLTSIEQAKEMIESTTTKTGLSVTACVIKKAYEKGKTVAKEVIEKIKIKKDESIPKLNYVISPQ